MQGAMWVILAATVGLAALVNHERRRSMRVHLGAPIVSGAMTVRLPKTWQQSRAAGDRDGRVVAQAVEPDDQNLGRTVTITRDRVAAPVSPLEFLLSSNNQILSLELLTAQHARTSGEQLVEPITVGGWPGVLVRGVRAAGRGSNGANNLPHKELYGATVLPSGHAIVVKLEGDRPAELSDVEIVKQLAGALEVGAQPTMGQAGEILSLEGNVRVAAPEGFRPVYESDPNLVRRRLWPDGDATKWMAAELIPCLLAPENGDEAMAIRALAALHDPSLRDAAVTPDGPRRWRISPPAGTAAVAATRSPRGYFLADDLADAGALSGGPRRALMAFFYGAAAAAASNDVASPGAPDAIDDAWAAVARSVSFVGKTDVGSLLDAGRDEVERLRKVGLPNLLPARGNQWWLWSDESERDNVGWTHTTWTVNRRGDPTTPETSGGVSETVFLAPNAGVGAAAGAFRAKTTWTGELRRYDADATLTPGAPSGEPIRRRATLVPSSLTIRLYSRTRTVADGTGPVPAQFVSGAWLPLLVGKLSNQPMILKSDAFLAREPIAAPNPMLLLVQPVTEQSAQTDADNMPLRCVSVRVNGSGESSRWYIGPNGEIHHVGFARGLRRTPSDDKTISFTFGADAVEAKQ
jgi:hypothetical protein